MLWSQTTFTSQGSYWHQCVSCSCCVSIAGGPGWGDSQCCRWPLSGSQAGSTVPIWKLASHLGRGVSALEGLAWHYEMSWLEATPSTPAHNPGARDPVQEDRGLPWAQKSESWKCWMSTTSGHHSMVALQSPASKWASSRSCFSFAVLNASLNMHIWPYWLKPGKLFSGGLGLKWSRHLNLAEQGNKTRLDLYLINSAVACPGVC